MLTEIVVPKIGEIHIDLPGEVWSYKEDPILDAEIMIDHGLDPVAIYKSFKDKLEKENSPEANKTLLKLSFLIRKQIKELREDLENCFGCGKPHKEHEEHRIFPIIFKGEKVCKLCKKDAGLHHKPIQRIKPIELLRMSESWLKSVIELNNSHSPHAQALLKDLYLECTTPWNEVITPGWKDSYTGEIFPKDEEVWIEPSEWNHYIQNRAREIYPEDLETRTLFIEANTQGFGQIDTEELDDDRGFLPDHMQEEFVIESGWDLRREIREMCWEGQSKINNRLEEIDQVKRKAAYYKDHGMTDQQRKLRGIIPRKRLEIEKIKRETARDIEDKLESWTRDQTIQDILVAAHVAHEWFINMEEINIGGFNLMQFAEDNPDIIDRIGTGGGISTEQLEDFDDKTFTEILETYPLVHEDTTLTRAWNEGYIRAIMAGAPLDGKRSAKDRAWDAYRQKISPAGQAEFNKVIAKGAQHTREAWQAFYSTARQNGEIWAVPALFNEKGVQIKMNIGGTFRQHIDWNKAAQMYLDGKLKLDAKRARRALENQDWAKPFLDILST